jgi:hypothetical protein
MDAYRRLDTIERSDMDAYRYLKAARTAIWMLVAVAVSAR